MKDTQENRLFNLHVKACDISTELQIETKEPSKKRTLVYLRKLSSILIDLTEELNQLPRVIK